MYLEINMSSAVLSSAVPYKYTVFSPKTRNSTNNNDIYEFLDANIGISKVTANRVLLPDDFKEKKGTPRTCKIRIIYY